MCWSMESSDAFPAGLRVLVVDQDASCSKLLHKLLIKCCYKVTVCTLAQEALDLLGRDGFDIVMSDVNVEDMDVFEFLEQVGQKMDLPVILMSVDGDTSRVMKGLQHGACDYLLKPVKMKEARNIWQHVFRKRMSRVTSVEAKESLEETHDSSTFSGDMAIVCKKRKDSDLTSVESSDPSSVKKARVVWTQELHQKFVVAVDRIGLDKVGPKKILDLMGVPWLTRENVASHLQKYRLNLSRRQKENDGMRVSDFSLNEGPTSVTLQQNIVINENYASAAGQAIHVHSHGSMPLQAEGENHLFGDFAHPEMNRSSGIGYDQAFELLKSESRIQAHYSSSSLFKSHFQPAHLLDHFPVSHSQGHSRIEVYHDQNQAMEANTNHFYNKNKSYAIVTDQLPFPEQGYLTHCHNALDFEEEQNLQNKLESSLKNMMIVPAAYENDMHVQNTQHVNMGSFGGSNEEVEFVAAAGAGARVELYEANNFEFANEMHVQNTQHVNFGAFGGYINEEEKFVVAAAAAAADARVELYEAHNFAFEKNNGVECYAREDLYFG